ncbi:MAG TPA: elongation factor P maturation arginine rhamnosyltransferase EarP, partial [Noviherbaspirillum sp.]
GIVVRHWRAQDSGFAARDVADIVIEFFACDIPEAYIAAMAEREPRAVWFNLEGLTAEEWVEGCHRLPSRHPRLPLTKHFFFPGFTDKTGGLIRESGLEEDRRRFTDDPAAVHDFLDSLGLSQQERQAFKVSLFCYPHAPAAALFDTWRNGNEPITCLVPEGVAREAVEAFIGGPAPAGATGSQGMLTVRVLPFLPQTDYDKLLWACDFNFVRGEDSFVRAQWAKKPFVWHIYPQDENLHHTKLRAFLGLYAPGLKALTEFSLAWNDAEATDLPAQWPALQAERQQILSRAENWCAKMQENGDVTANMLKFAESIASDERQKQIYCAVVPERVVSRIFLINHALTVRPAMKRPIISLSLGVYIL